MPCTRTSRTLDRGLSMEPADNLMLAALILLAAILYSSVGHAGASGYIAAMALFGVDPAVMKPTALVLNVFVASIATWHFYRAGCFDGKIFWPLAIASVPAAFLGGFISLPGHIYKPMVGVVLLYAAWRSFAAATQERTAQAPHLGWLLFTGIGIGFLSGLTGVGGGIFLSPLLILAGWAATRQVSGIAAAFILVNSLAGLAGVLAKHPVLPEALPMWVVAAVVGGLIGAGYGARRFGSATLKRVLALVLVVAGGKMLLT